MLIEQIIDFSEFRVISVILNLNWGGLSPLAVHVLVQLVIFMTKQKFLRNFFDCIIIYYKILQETMYFTFLYWAKSQNLTPKCKILNVFGLKL